MKTVSKKWTHLGLGAALAGSALLAACGPGTQKADPAPEPTQVITPTEDLDIKPVDAGEGGEGEAGEGGEGEGGVAIERAGTDPVVFRSALAITEAHIVAARDAFLEGATDAAAEMFAHPVSEVLADVGPYLAQQGVVSFDDLLIDASGAVFDGETAEQISARTDAIIARLREAATKAPKDGSSEARIQLGVVADQLDRAAVMYGIAGESDAYEPYLDGYGFYKAAMAAYELEKSAIMSEYPDAAAAIDASLSLMAEAYPSVLRPETLDQTQAALTASASAVLLAIGG